MRALLGSPRSKRFKKGSLRLTLFLIAFAMSTALQAINYTVNDAGSGSDSNLNDNVCSTATPANNSTCTLRAALQEANGKTGPHTVKFAAAITKITLSASLPQITAPMVLDGTNAANALSGGRVELDGNSVTSCFVLTDVTTAVNSTGAKGSTIKNFVIRRCSGDGISLSGHGYSVLGNRIGTNAQASSASSASDANAGAGVSVSGTAPVPAAPPTLGSLLMTLPDSFAGVTALSGALQAALTVIANPNTIAGNVISGNNGNGISIFGQGTVNTIVTGNIVGLSQDALSAIPNGRGPGGASNRAGIRLSGTAYGNFIGPGNIVSGNAGHGISLDSGAVLLPNFVAGNLVGLGSAPIEVGNAENGIAVDSFPKTTGPGANNPTGIAAIIGPANTISDNQSPPPSNDLDVVNADTSGGLLVTGSSNNIRIFGNVIGLATFPAGSTPLGQLNFGNTGNGMVITTPNNDIRNNLILANSRHGILLRGSSTVNNVIRGNYIGVSVPTGLSALVGLGNTGDGIYFSGASSNFVGGGAANDANVIAGNRRNGVALRNGSSTNGWANLIQRNKIYGNAVGGSGIGIDLERVLNASDPLDLLTNPGTNYANFDQHRPAICGGANDPPACAGAKPPSFGGASTLVQWTLTNRPNANNTIRVEFYATAANGSDQMFLGEKIISTDGLGVPTGAGCVNGLCTSSVGGSVDTVGMMLQATSTDILPSDVPPLGNQPAPLPLSPANNTSEFSDPVMATRALSISTLAPLAGGTTGQPYSISFSAVGGSGVYNNWVISGGGVPNGLSLAQSTGVLSGTASAAGTFNFTVQLTDTLGATAIAAYTIKITAAPPLVITTPSPLPSGTVGSNYSASFSASGGTGVASNWLIMTGNLPAGITLTPATGTLSGVPTEVGVFQFNVQVTDAQPTTVIRAYSLTVVPAPVPLAISTASPLANATADVSYNASFTAVGGTGIYSGWAITTGALPSGLQISASTGAITGKATQAGSFNFTLRVTDSAATMATKAFALTVLAAPPQPVAPQFIASPAEIDFGSVKFGNSAIVNVVLSNLSTTSATPVVRPSGLPNEFITDAGTCTAALAPGTNCTMTVRFRPTAGHGKLYQSTAFVCRAPVLPNGICLNSFARLNLKGIGSGSLGIVAPTRIDFGSQLVGSVTNVNVIVTNPTAGPMFLIPQLTLSNPVQFSVPTQTCGTGLINPAQSCAFTFAFSPSTAGASSSATRITLSIGSFSEDYDITLSGNGINTATPSFTTPMTLDFGAVNIGDVAGPFTGGTSVTTRNASGVPLTISAAPFGPADASTWSVTPQNVCLSPIANAATCSHTYKFTPRARGDYSINTQLNVSGSSVNQTVPISLTGTGVGSLMQVSPMQLDFGSIGVGSTGSGQVTLTNLSNVALTRTFSSAAPFNFSTGCGASLSPGASCVINYTFAADGDPLGTVASEATLFFENVATGVQETVRIGLQAKVVDALFANGFE